MARLFIDIGKIIINLILKKNKVRIRLPFFQTLDMPALVKMCGGGTDGHTQCKRTQNRPTPILDKGTSLGEKTAFLNGMDQPDIDEQRNKPSTKFHIS